MTAKAIHAHLFLAGYIVRHVLHMAIPGARRRRGVTRFRQSFYPESLFPATPLLRDVMPQGEGCLNCDLCMEVTVPAGAISPRDLVLRVARSSNHWQRAVPALAPGEIYLAAEELCPSRIPLRSIAAAIREAAFAPASAPASAPSV